MESLRKLLDEYLETVHEKSLEILEEFIAQVLEELLQKSVYMICGKLSENTSERFREHNIEVIPVRISGETP